ncbi:hypothetical protein OH76DRAFT_1465175 [Lentinus brumalis]|uniref:TRIP4/RQT4 C2HC5-type zinc finger domain-containing protein n=1 Tax=Lentinus brumalis TaxID=2498619 RepID=A0A371D3N9_9APHY|nr:hypothetical protein OH76DRAFT_1465175 [Polyporus brumalis]
MNSNSWVREGRMSVQKIAYDVATRVDESDVGPKLREVGEVEVGGERDPKGGCFCQARMHALSTHTPICRSCGLILCELNLPNFACPHCNEALLTPAVRDALIQTLESRIDETLAKEEAERQRAIQEARAAQGAFPTLSASASRSGTPDVHPVNQTHKVLSLDSKTRKVKVSTYTPPAVSRAASTEKIKQQQQQQKPEPEYKRVPPPPPEVSCSSAPLNPHHRPWANTRGLNVTYVPPGRA